MTGHCITWRLWLLWWNWIHSLSDELHLTAVPRNAIHSKDSPCIFVGFFDYSAILLISTAKVIPSHSEKVHKLIFLSWYVSCAFGVPRASQQGSAGQLHNFEQSWFFQSTFPSKWTEKRKKINSPGCCRLFNMNSVTGLHARNGTLEAGDL